jgi:hypothetical protein
MQSLTRKVPYVLITISEMLIGGAATRDNSEVDLSSIRAFLRIRVRSYLKGCVVVVAVDFNFNVSRECENLSRDSRGVGVIQIPRVLRFCTNRAAF